MLIGLTGGIGSRKSLAGDFFRSKNIDVIDADDLAHNALDIEGEGYKNFLDIFRKNFSR
jgi:Dephospho-CoA kinase